jgi:hypothetical protein
MAEHHRMVLLLHEVGRNSNSNTNNNTNNKARQSITVCSSCCMNSAAFSSPNPR